MSRLEHNLVPPRNAGQILPHLSISIKTVYPPYSAEQDSQASPEMPSSEPSSASPSPTLNRQSLSQVVPPLSQLSRSSSRKPSCTPSMESIPEDTPVSPAEHQGQCYHIDREVISTLTGLLNCETVRNDERMRLCVQSQLMEAELELRRQRRRRSGAARAQVA